MSSREPLLYSILLLSTMTVAKYYFPWWQDHRISLHWWESGRVQGREMCWRQKRKIKVNPLEAENLSWRVCEVPRTLIISTLSFRQKKYESFLENPAHPGRDLNTFMSPSQPINKWDRSLTVKLKVEKLHPLAQDFHSPSINISRHVGMAEIHRMSLAWKVEIKGKLKRYIF